MLLEFTILPVGRGESLSEDVAAVVDLIDRSGIPYRLTPMSTVVEGEWDELLALVKRCHDLVRSRCSRVSTTIHIDDRGGAVERLSGKIASVERRLGRQVHQ
jgi:uncharacterized protein (TIGR00106 family)